MVLGTDLLKLTEYRQRDCCTQPRRPSREPTAAMSSRSATGVDTLNPTAVNPERASRRVAPPQSCAKDVDRAVEAATNIGPVTTAHNTARASIHRHCKGRRRPLHPRRRPRDRARPPGGQFIEPTDFVDVNPTFA